MKSDFDPKKVLRVSIDNVRPNLWNPKFKGDSKEYRQIVQSLKVNGFVTPITVRENDNDESEYEICDGETRWLAAKELGFEEIYVYNLGEISDGEAKSTTLNYQLQVPWDEIDLAPIVLELNAIGMEIPFDGEEVERYKELMAFDMSEYSTDGADLREEDDGVEGFKTLKLKMDKEELKFVQDRIRSLADDEMVSEGRSLELICADYLSGVDYESNS